jgi:hypothetical protein
METDDAPSTSPRPSRHHLESAFIALAAFAVYALLCAPVSGMGDSSEFTLVLATNGVAHPTGYPLYTLFGHVFCVILHAFTVGWPLAAALWSATGGAIAVFFLRALAVELIDPESPASPTTRLLATVIPVALFAFQPVVLGGATNAEVNIWSLAWACAAAYVFTCLMRAIRAGAAAEAPRAARAAALWGLVCGAGLAHHLTSIWISASLTAGLGVALVRRRRLAPPLVMTAFGATLVPLSSYGIIAWHAWHPAKVQWLWLDPGWTSVVRHVTGAQYQLFLGSFAPNPFQKELLAGAVYPFLLPGLVLLALGALRARDTERRIAAWSLFVAALLATVFIFRYGVPDPAPYFLPAMALGVAAAAPALASIPGVGTRAGTIAIAALGLAGAFPIAAWLRDGSEERRATLEFDATIRSMWSAISPDTALVSWTDDRFLRLREYQILRGEKPALLVVTPDVLFANSVRAEIRDRFGADPLLGFESPHLTRGAPSQERIIGHMRRRLLDDLNARIRAPVILFDPSKPIVFQLRKPWDPADDVHDPRPAHEGK